MTRFMLAAGVAALAIAAPSAARPDRAGNPGGGHAAQAQQRGGGQARVERTRARAQFAQPRQRNAFASERRANRMANVQRVREARAQRAPAARMERAQLVRQARVERSQRVRDLRAGRMERIRVARIEKSQRIRDQRSGRMERIRGARNAQIAQIERVRAIPVDRRAAVRDMRFGNRLNERVAVGYGVGGCPPGLANRPVACMPPGQARKLLGQPLSQVAKVAALSALPQRLTSLYPTTADSYYRYGDGYVYRVNRSNNLVSALLPLFGLGYGIGQPFPASYPSYGLPMGYQPFYPDTPYSSYRYANGYVYQVDPFTGLIEDVDPMLGYGYGYGQMLPPTYSAYNVPYQYRPLYYDTSDAYYRYAPGAIYQVDPKTSLITAIASLLAPGLMVGQPLPVGYSAYNLPYAYRSNYYDTPDAWYRYSNGNIYRVDPATQLVTALVASALT